MERRGLARRAGLQRKRQVSARVTLPAARRCGSRQSGAEAMSELAGERLGDGRGPRGEVVVERRRAG